MEIVYNARDLREYMETAVKISPRHPVLVDKYLKGVELEVDAISDGKDCFIPGILEHLERAGVHSGDSIAVYPPVNVSEKVRDEIVACTGKLARALRIKGVFNIQYVCQDEKLYVLEVNPRSSRTVPFLSKVTGIPIVNLATKIALGKSLGELGYKDGLHLVPDFTSVKAPVFSFSKLYRLETSLGPEMKSTGEVMGINKSFSMALNKALLASGLKLPHKGRLLVTIADKDKQEALPLIRKLALFGFNIIATRGTALFLDNAGIEVELVSKIAEGFPNVIDLIQTGRVDLVINTFTRGKKPMTDGFRIRRAAVEQNVPCFTSLDTALAMGNILEELKQGADCQIKSLQEHLYGDTVS